MQVRELRSIETLHSLQLLAGEGGLDNLMRDVVLLEYESLKQKTPNYYQEDFIVTTLFYAKDDTTLLLPTVERLIDLGAAGLAFKSVYYQALPPSVLELAEQRNFPIFVFDQLYMEDVILSISDYIRLRQEFSMFEEPIRSILSGSESSGNIQQLCSRMNPSRQKFMCGIYIHAVQPNHPWSSILQDALRMRTAQDLMTNYRFLQFRRGFFAIYNSAQSPDLESLAGQCGSLLQALGCSTNQLSYGVSGIHQLTEDFDCVLREAFDALTAALLLNRNQVLFPTLGIYHMVFPMLRDKSARRRNDTLLSLLSDYDQDSGTGSLTQTLQTYIAHNYDIRRTAQVMGQHPNTIRYRMKKIGDLLDIPEHAEEAMFLLGEYLRLDAVQQMIF